MVKKEFKCISISATLYNDLRSEKDKCESWDDAMSRILSTYRTARTHLDSVKKW